MPTDPAPPGASPGAFPRAFGAVPVPVLPSAEFQRRVRPAVAAASEAATVARGDALLARVETLTVETHRILDAAKRDADHELALRAIARLEKQTELLARLLGELRDGPTVDLFVGGEFQVVVNVLLGVLAPHSALRAEVGTALARMAGAEADDGPEVARAA
jgi:hypothetical protein